MILSGKQSDSVIRARAGAETTFLPRLPPFTLVNFRDLLDKHSIELGCSPYGMSFQFHINFEKKWVKVS